MWRVLGRQGRNTVGLLQECTWKRAGSGQFVLLRGIGRVAIAIPATMRHLIKGAVVNHRHFVATKLGCVIYASVHLPPAGMTAAGELETILVDLGTALRQLAAGAGPGGSNAVIIGGDFNTALLPDMPWTTGSEVTPAPARWAREAPRRRIVEAFLCEQRLRAANTFVRQERGPWTWERRRVRSARRRWVPRQRAQIDFVMLGAGVEGDVQVGRRGRIKSDHRPLLCHASVRRPVAAGVREPQLTGWMPSGAAEAEEFRERVRLNLASAAAERHDALTPHLADWEACIAEAAAATPHTTTASRMRAKGAASEIEKGHRRQWRIAVTAEARLDAKRAYLAARRARWRSMAKQRIDEICRSTRARKAAVTVMTTEDGQQVYDIVSFAGLQTTYLSRLWAAAPVGEAHLSAQAAAAMTGARAAARLDGRDPRCLDAWSSDAAAMATFSLELGSITSHSVGTDGPTVTMLRALDWDQRAGLDQAMRRTVSGEMRVPHSWTTDKVVAIRKDKVPAPRAKGLRYLRQGALLQKVAARTLRDAWRPLPPWVLGGLAGSRADDVAEVVRACATLAAEWSNPAFACTIGAADVFRAYDCINLNEST